MRQLHTMLVKAVLTEAMKQVLAYPVTICSAQFASVWPARQSAAIRAAPLQCAPSAPPESAQSITSALNAANPRSLFAPTCPSALSSRASACPASRVTARSLQLKSTCMKTTASWISAQHAQCPAVDSQRTRAMNVCATFLTSTQTASYKITPTSRAQVHKHHSCSILYPYT